MKYSPSITMVTALACREAIAGGFGEIEPEHIVMGALKLTEIDTEQLAAAGQDPAFNALLGTEQKEIGELLRQRNIDPTDDRIKGPNGTMDFLGRQFGLFAPRHYSDSRAVQTLERSRHRNAVPFADRRARVRRSRRQN